MCQHKNLIVHHQTLLWLLWEVPLFLQSEKSLKTSVPAHEFLNENNSFARLSLSIPYREEPAGSPPEGAGSDGFGAQSFLWDPQGIGKGLGAPCCPSEPARFALLCSLCEVPLMCTRNFQRIENCVCGPRKSRVKRAPSGAVKNLSADFQ